MKKIILAAILTMFASSVAYAGVNIGVSGQMGLFAGSATENDTGTHGTTSGPDEKNKESDYLGLGYMSIFIEKTLGDRGFIGFDYVPSALESETKDTIRNDKTTQATQGASEVTQKIQVDFEDLRKIYLGLNVTDNMYVSAGLLYVDVVTNESLGTGSKYGNTDMDGVAFGVGYNNTMDSGMFIRFEGNYLSFDGASLKSDTGVNKITIDNLDGVTGKVSIGKSF